MTTIIDNISQHIILLNNYLFRYDYFVYEKPYITIIITQNNIIHTYTYFVQ